MKDFEKGKESEEDYRNKCIDNLKQRDNSKIVDLFYGYSRTVIDCPDCNHESLKYEEFSMVTLPVKKDLERIIIYIQELHDIYKMEKIESDVNSTVTLSSAKEIILKELELDPRTVHFYKFNTERKSFERAQDENATLVSIDRDSVWILNEDMPKESLETTELSMIRFYVNGVENDKSNGILKYMQLPKRVKPSYLFKLVFKIIEQNKSRRIDLDKFENYFQVEKTEGDKKPSPIFKLHITKEKSGFQEILLTKEDEEIELPDQESINIQILSREIKVSDRLSELTIYKKTLPIELSKARTLSIYDCLDEYGKEERLDEKNQWHCPVCKKMVTAKISTTLEQTPPNMIVHLKRFSKGRGLYRKMLDFIDFPLTNLDLTKYMSVNLRGTPVKYDLYAVINHYGDVGGGHYTAFAKTSKSPKWYEFDDSTVSEIKPEHVVSKSAYVLFYKRQSPN